VEGISSDVWPRVGEFRRVWLMQLNVFLLILALWIIKLVVNAQFISRVGIDKLPLVFLLIALTAWSSLQDIPVTSPLAAGKDHESPTCSPWWVFFRAILITNSPVSKLDKLYFLYRCSLFVW
jgi:hypothetical protein